MKVKVLTLLVTMSFIAFGAHVNAAEEKAMTAGEEAKANISPQDIIDAIKNAINSPAGITALCKKGSFFGGKYSIRSLDGKFCSQPIIGAIAEVLCTSSNPENYTGSKCHNNAVAALGGKKAEDYLKEVVGEKGSTAFNIFCQGQHAFAPGGVLATIAASCPK